MDFTEIDAACAAFAQQEKTPGLAVGVVREGALVHAVALGSADLEASRGVTADTAFRIASMTKHMTALAVLALRDAGKLALDAPVAEYVPQFAKVAPATRDSAPVTLRHLLSHAAGFVTDDPWGDRVMGMTPAELDAMIAQGRLFARAPGLAFEYSNLAYGLVGRAITNVSGEPYQSFIRRTILQPLGMTRTTFDAIAATADDFAFGYREDDGTFSRERLEPDGEVGAMGGLVTTVPDYARWVAFLLNAWPARDDPEAGPARRASIREMGLWHSMPWMLDRGTAPEASAYGYGLMSSVHATLGRRLHHSGGLPGYGSHVLMLPDRGWSVFAFANRTYAPMSRLTLQLAEALADTMPPARAVPASPFLTRAVDTVVAAYNAGRIEVPGAVFAVNFLLDMPAPQRDRELSRLKERLGEGKLDGIEPIHALSGRFALACARGRLTGTVTLSPDPVPGLQSLVLTEKPA